MKTVQDYMNDPRMLNDPAMAGALEPIKEIHAIRLMLQDEMIGMSFEEKAAYNKQGAMDFFAKIGLPFPKCVNLTGQGKMKPKITVTS
jgi:hypothetical protein